MVIRASREQALGGFGNAYYQHAVELEVYVEEGDAAAREVGFDALLQQIGAALDADPTLGDLVFGLTYGRPMRRSPSRMREAMTSACSRYCCRRPRRALSRR